MISKKELLNKIDKIKQRRNVLNTWDAFCFWANSLPDDQPDVLPFQWPIPDGMEVCYYNEGKFYYVLTDVVYHPNASKEYCDVSGIDDLGHLHLYRMEDLFLRRVEKKVWVVEHKSGTALSAMYYDQKNRVDQWMDNNQGATLYEATLKPVV